MASNLFATITGLPKLIAKQAIQPLRVALRRPLPQPKTQRDFAQMVNDSLRHQIRAGFSHRFINLLFVTVGDRVFCRRYSYAEPSWHSVFKTDPQGQIKLDKTIVTIKAQTPEDLNTIASSVDDAYAVKLAQLGASFLLGGAVEPRAQQSTMELLLADPSEHTSSQPL